MNFPDETGKMSEGQKGGAPAEVQEKHAREGFKKGLRLKEKIQVFASPDGLTETRKRHKQI